jgi:glutathione peroxidase
VKRVLVAGQALVLALVLVPAVACSTTEPTASQPAPPSPQVPRRDAGVPPPVEDPEAGPDAAACEPGAPGELYALSAKNLTGKDTIPLCRYRGKVLLVVNVASKCGYTPQYAPLQDLYEKYADKGFYVLGFPCNQFGGQEPGTAEEISEFCTTEYGITFPLFGKIEVNGAGTDPIYLWLKAQPGGAGDITWNFNKFLIGRDGKLVKRWSESTVPSTSDVVTAIEAALAK